LLPLQISDMPRRADRNSNVAGTAGGETPYRPGVKEDFDRLYQSTYQRIFATLMLILRNHASAEDATQEAYLRAFGAWSRWKQDAPAEAWMYRIALNVAFTHRRRERLHEIGEVLRRLGRPKLLDPGELDQTDLKRELRALPLSRRRRSCSGTFTALATGRSRLRSTYQNEPWPPAWRRPKTGCGAV
jgi:Sigma-70 region 2